MQNLYATVVRHLKTQRDSTAELKLWNELWNAYEKHGSEGVADIIDKIIELPESDYEEQS